MPVQKLADPLTTVSPFETKEAAINQSETNSEITSITNRNTTNSIKNPATTNPEGKSPLQVQNDSVNK